MSLSATLWTMTGMTHSVIGLVIPELQTPLLRILKELRVVPAGVETDAAVVADRYERKAAFWFQFAGVMMMIEGMIWKYHVQVTKCEELPTWWGVSVLVMGVCGVVVMPASGFWLAIAQGIRIVWNQHQLTSAKGNGKRS